MRSSYPDLTQIPFHACIWNKSKCHVETFHITAFLSCHKTAVHTGIMAAGSQQGALETQTNWVTKEGWLLANLFIRLKCTENSGSYFKVIPFSTRLIFLKFKLMWCCFPFINLLSSQSPWTSTCNSHQGISVCATHESPGLGRASMGLRYGIRIFLWIFWFHSACIAVGMGGSTAVYLLPHCCVCPSVSAEVLLTSRCPACMSAWDCTLHFGSSNKNFTFQLE